MVICRCPAERPEERRGGGYGIDPVVRARPAVRTARQVVVYRQQPIGRQRAGAIAVNRLYFEVLSHDSSSTGRRSDRLHTYVKRRTRAAYYRRCLGHARKGEMHGRSSGDPSREALSRRFPKVDHLLACQTQPLCNARILDGQRPPELGEILR